MADTKRAIHHMLWGWLAEDAASAPCESPSAPRTACLEKQATPDTLIARLRSAHDEWFECCGDVHLLLAEAADALETLRAQVDYIVSCQDDKRKNPGDELLETRAQHDAAREALRQVVEAIGAALADHVKYPQLRLPEFQVKRLKRALAGKEQP